MFFPRSTAPRVREADLAELRLSLNAPVIGTDALPRGPARAAIALVRERGGRFVLAIGVRSLRTGETAVFTPDESYPDAGAAAVGVDAALSFAEGMGFLFDDDELAAPVPDARDRAFARWCELLGEPHEEADGDAPVPCDDPDEPFETVLGAASTPGDGPTPAGVDPEPPGEELVLEDAVPDDTVLSEPLPEVETALPGLSPAGDPIAAASEPSIFDDPEPALEGDAAALPDHAPAPTAVEPIPAPALAREATAPDSEPPAEPSPEPRGPQRAAPLALTKFRRSPELAIEPPELAAGVLGAADAPPGGPPPAKGRPVLVTPHGPALGRLQLVKRRRDPEGAPQPSWLQRLLGSF